MFASGKNNPNYQRRYTLSAETVYFPASLNRNINFLSDQKQLGRQVNLGPFKPVLQGFQIVRMGGGREGGDAKRERGKIVYPRSNYSTDDKRYN